jgi:hypothetical protein
MISVAWMRRTASAILAACLTVLYTSAFAAGEDINALFAEAAATLQQPAQVGLESGAYALHPGEKAYVPAVAPLITAFDQAETTEYPPVQGSFSSTDEAVVTVDEQGVMTAVADGMAVIDYETAEGLISCIVTVSEDAPTEIAKNMAYVAQLEYYQTHKARLPKYNKYAKWYYGRRNEVGWCAVFAIWCANAAGTNPIDETAAAEIPDSETLYLREGQVGNQYDGYFKLGRFGPIPRVGYMVAYADMSNGYRTTHIGIVVKAEDLGDGVYKVTTVEGNMSNSIKSYCYLYDSKLPNHLVGADPEVKLKLQWNMSEVEEAEQTNPLLQYELHTDHWSVFGFGESWK